MSVPPPSNTTWPGGCAATGNGQLYVATYALYGAFDIVLLILSIFSLRLIKKKKIVFTREMKFTRYFILFVLSFKAIANISNSCLVKTKIFQAKFLFTSFPGYLVQIAFFLSLITWCSLFMEFASKGLKVFFKILRIISYIFIPISLIIYFTFYGFMLDSYKSKRANEIRMIENIYALSVDFTQGVVFFTVFIIISKFLNVNLCGFKSEQRILWMCVVIGISLFVRGGCRIYFQIGSSTMNIVIFNCSTGQLVSLVLREFFGCIVPFLFFCVSDIITYTEEDIRQTIESNEILGLPLT